MAEITFRIREISGGVVSRELAAVERRLGDLSPFFAGEGKRIVAGSIGDEFFAGLWKKPGGGQAAWAPAARDYGHPLLMDTLRLFRSWTNPANYIATRRELRIEVDTPYAKYHRGEPPGRNPPRRGNWFMPARPHATDNPDMRDALREGIRRFVLGSFA